VNVLALYQRRLSELLLAGEAPEEIRAALKADPRLSSLRDYVDGLQDAPLQVATALAAKWGGL